MTEKVTAFKSRSGALFDTELKAQIDDVKYDLDSLLRIRSYPIAGYSISYIIEKIVENKVDIINILKTI